MTLEQLGFRITEVSESGVEYIKKTDDSKNIIDIDFQRNEIMFGEFLENRMIVWSAPLEVIQASIEVLNARKVVIDFDK